MCAEKHLGNPAEKKLILLPNSEKAGFSETCPQAELEKNQNHFWYEISSGLRISKWLVINTV